MLFIISVSSFFTGIGCIQSAEEINFEIRPYSAESDYKINAYCNVINGRGRHTINSHLLIGSGTQEKGHRSTKITIEPQENCYGDYFFVEMKRSRFPFDAKFPFVSINMNLMVKRLANFLKFFLLFIQSLLIPCKMLIIF